MDKKELGNKGEQIASDYLKKIGYKILETNFRKRTGEIDIIAEDPEMKECVFIEVKTRKSKTFGYPEESVDNRKLKKLITTANIWLEDKKEQTWRIDIIAIEMDNYPPKITHIKNITQDFPSIYDE
jgi:putative endonuclease